MKRRQSKRKVINPVYWIFCEGKTEEAYADYLRSRYRLPIELVAKISGSKINEGYIKRAKQGKSVHPKDKHFLVYDGDVAATIDQLKKIKESTLIVSNPSIEIWFPYHYRSQHTAIGTMECIKEISKCNNYGYKKGFLDIHLKHMLDSKGDLAVKRAKVSVLFRNPSSNMYELIDGLDAVKKASLV